MKKPRKKTTKASRRARSSSVFSAIRATARVTPGSLPSSVRYDKTVSPIAAISTATSTQRPGSAALTSASRPRQSRTSAVSASDHAGRCAACGSTVQAMTASRNSVSRASRGRRFQPGQYGTARRVLAASVVAFTTGAASSTPERERLEAARALRVAVARIDHRAGQAQAVVGVGAIGGERPGGQARQALLGSEAAARRPVEPELVPCRGAGVAADEIGAGLERLGRLLPCDQLQRIAAAVRAHALDLA